jgi:hypothetical protein
MNSEACAPGLSRDSMSSALCGPNTLARIFTITDSPGGPSILAPRSVRSHDTHGVVVWFEQVLVSPKDVKPTVMSCSTQ